MLRVARSVDALDRLARFLARDRWPTRSPTYDHTQGEDARKAQQPGSQDPHRDIVSISENPASPP